MDELNQPDDLETTDIQAPTGVDADATPTSIVDEIDDNELSVYIINRLQADIRDREAFGWNAMRVYDEYAYNGYKKKANEPWNNASNYSVRMTTTLVDTAHANTIGSIFADPNKVADVEGIGKEDVRNAKNISSLINWQVLNDIDDAKDVLDKAVHTAFKHGNSPIKVIQGSGIAGQKKKIIWRRINIWNMFLPVNAQGVQPRHTDHVFELIPLDENDWESRKGLKGPDGKVVYDGIEDLGKGNYIFSSTGMEEITTAKDRTSGTSLGDMYSRDMRYILECYLTYPHKDKKTNEVTLVELVVTLAPNGGKVMRKVENTDIDEATGDAVRPYVWKFQPYPREDRAYGDSLPWLIRQSQEELDYAHNQVFNAIEKIVKTPTFYDPNGGFDPEEVQMTPNGWYPVPNPNQNIFIPSYDYGSIFQHYRSFDLYWEYAQRQTGLTELFQGRQQDRQTTLGEAEIRTNKAEIRFKVIYDRLEAGFSELLYLTYFYDRKWLPEDTVIKVLGTSDYKAVAEIFPEGISGLYNFRFSSAPLTEKAKRRNDIEQAYLKAMSMSMVANSDANQWKLLNWYWEELGFRNLGDVISKPKEANIMSPQEAIQRIMSGEYEIIPDPGIDAPDYILRLKSFMRSDTFKKAKQEEKQAIMTLLRRVDMIRMGQQLAIQDAQILKQRMAQEAAVMGNSDMTESGVRNYMNGASPDNQPAGVQ